ncbi:MAG: FtsX-like permease family protein [Ideonella sp.]|nr:FtsX-like permease family protein [Ideonella sp.]
MSGLFGFERRVAMRFLREGRMQSALIIFGVAAGVAVVTYISALINGLQANTLAETLGAQAHLTVYPPDDVVRPAAARSDGTTTLSGTQARAQRLQSIANWGALQAAVQTWPGVAAVSPMVTGAALAQRGEASRAIALAGVELERYDRIVQLRDKVVAGTARLAPGDAILGRELAADLGVQVGDRIAVSTGSVPEVVLVTALVDLGIRDLNRRTVLVPLRAAQSLLGLPGGATRLDVTVDDVWQAQAITDAFRARHPVKVESWQEANAQLVSALNAQSVSTGVIRAVVLVVVVLGIASVLVVSVVQKQREIGILRAMGATRGQVIRIFLLQGAIVGAVGSALGVVLAAGLVWAFATFVKGSDGQALFPIVLAPTLAIQVALLATVCGVLAAIAPARRAAALDPAQAIRL